MRRKRQIRSLHRLIILERDAAAEAQSELGAYAHGRWAACNFTLMAMENRWPWLVR